MAFDKKNDPLGRNLLDQLDKNFPKKGKKVYNLLAAGYFDKLILPFIEVFKSIHPEDQYIGEFQKFYQNILKFFPIAIFVGNNMSESVLEIELKRRLNLKSIPFIKLHAIGEENIKKIEVVMAKFQIDKDKNFSIKDNRFTTPSGLKAQLYEIKIIENHT